MKTEISTLINKSHQKKVNYGIYIINARTGKRIFKHNHTAPLIPASNMKLITTAAALDQLGNDFKFVTKIGLCGNKLVIISDGDPLLGDQKVNAKHNRPRYWPLENIVSTVSKKDIKSIDGIITDTRVFDDQRVHPSWPADQLNKWYACEVSGLNFNNNCIDILVRNSKGRIYYSMIPRTGYINLKNQCRTVSKGNSAVGAYRTNLENHLILKGKVNKSAQFTLAIERPAGFFAYILAENLISEGITMKGQIVEGPKPSDCDFKLLAEYENSIIDVIERSNRDSLGLATEALIKKLGCSPSGKNGSWRSGAEKIADYLEKIGISSSQFNISDGSGLSRENRLSAKALVHVMKDLCSDNTKKNVILNSLSVAGVNGTASKWFNSPEYKGKILLKTGYIDGVRSYTGLCKTKNGNYIFSIITNKSNWKSRNVMNDIIKAVIDYYN